MRFRVNKRARFTSSMVAGVCFIGLAVWGWGLPLHTVAVFFALCIGFLALIVGAAAVVAWIASYIRRLRDKANDDHF